MDKMVGRLFGGEADFVVTYGDAAEYGAAVAYPHSVVPMVMGSGISAPAMRSAASSEWLAE